MTEIILSLPYCLLGSMRSKKMKKYAVIVAGGAGLRAGGEIPKQFQMLNGIPMLWWAVRAFYKEDNLTNIRIVMHPGYFDLWDTLYEDLPEEDHNIRYEIICGGRTRLESVSNGIMGIAEDEESLTAIHDAARPLVSVSMIRRGWVTALEKKSAVPVVPMIDSIRELLVDGSSKTVDRSHYVRVQTPQIFDTKLLKEAYNSLGSSHLTDDASVIEATGRGVALYDGDEKNIKVSNPEDFQIASILLEEILRK